ncbi:hypothetical protein SPP_1445 [Streptococcus pneumoniae P1031]|nr:hypothetical protein SPP_1445 [Streptococcus pneumoniae P1031]
MAKSLDAQEISCLFYFLSDKVGAQVSKPIKLNKEVMS